MAVTVGTDVYWATASVDSYWSDRGNSAWAALATTDKEVNMRKATDWIDRNFRFPGEKKTTSQRLAWPRLKAYDWEGTDISDTIPREVEEAMAIVADLFRQGTFDLEGVVTDDAAAIKRQKVDVLEVEYDATRRLNGADIPSHVYQLLRPVTLQNKLLRA